MPDFGTPKKEIDFVAMDVETATTKGGICQIGIVTVIAGEITEEKQFMVRPPENKFDQVNICVHGITPDKTECEPALPAIWDEVWKLLDHHCVVGHNISFDLNALTKDAERYGLPEIKPSNIVCTCDIHRRARLKDVCFHYGIEISAHHNALCDARCSALVFLKYLEAKIYRPKIQKTKDEQDPWDNLHINSVTLVKDLENCKNSNTIFFDKITVITGVFERFPKREDLASLLKSYGADINVSISRKTDIVLMGSGAGPKKLEKIKVLNDSGEGHIHIIKEMELYKILDEYGQSR